MLNRVRPNALKTLILFTALFMFTAIPAVNPAGASSSDEAKKLLFKDADKVLRAAEEKQAERFAPKSFENGMKQYRKARDADSLDTVRKKLEEAVNHFNEALQTAEKANTLFDMAVTARNDAIKAKATDYASENWADAEKKLASAAKSLENGYEKNARSKGKDAEELYRQAELTAIKVRSLQTAWSLLKDAKDMKAKKYAPKTLEKAKMMAEKAEEMIERSRYDLEEVTELAESSAYEARHAIYLTEQVISMKKEKRSLEDMLLESEIPVRTIAETIGQNPQFDKGFENPVKDIVTRIKALKAEKNK